MRGGIYVLDRNVGLCDNSAVVPAARVTPQMTTNEWIYVKVHPGAGKNVLVSMGRGRFEAWVKTKPIAGEANGALVELLASTFEIPRTCVRLVKGRSGRHKVFRVFTPTRD